MTKPKAKIDPKSRALKPCPFCGGKAYNFAMSNNIEDEEDDEFGWCEYWIICEVCHCAGPLGETSPEAKTLWNERN